MLCEAFFRGKKGERFHLVSGEKDRGHVVTIDRGNGVRGAGPAFWGNVSEKSGGGNPGPFRLGPSAFGRAGTQGRFHRLQGTRSQLSCSAWKKQRSLQPPRDASIPVLLLAAVGNLWKTCWKVNWKEPTRF